LNSVLPHIDSAMFLSLWLNATQCRRLQLGQTLSV